MTPPALYLLTFLIYFFGSLILFNKRTEMPSPWGKVIPCRLNNLHFTTEKNKKKREFNYTSVLSKPSLTSSFYPFAVLIKICCVHWFCG